MSFKEANNNSSQPLHFDSHNKLREAEIVDTTSILIIQDTKVKTTSFYIPQINLLSMNKEIWKKSKFKM